ncbi:MAG: hypothetical protein V3W34_14155 [Phycisphaerae bacterium]
MPFILADVHKLFLRSVQRWNEGVDVDTEKFDADAKHFTTVTQRMALNRVPAPLLWAEDPELPSVADALAARGYIGELAAQLLQEMTYKNANGSLVTIRIQTGQAYPRAYLRVSDPGRELDPPPFAEGYGYQLTTIGLEFLDDEAREQRRQKGKPATATASKK